MWKLGLFYVVYHMISNIVVFLFRSTRRLPHLTGSPRAVLLVVAYLGNDHAIRSFDQPQLNLVPKRTAMRSSLEGIIGGKKLISSSVGYPSEATIIEKIGLSGLELLDQIVPVDRMPQLRPIERKELEKLPI
jgi:hypothetical protein